MWSLDYQTVKKTYLPTFIWDNSDSSYSNDGIDSSDSSVNSDSSDSSDSNDGSDSFDQTNLYTKKLNLPKTYLPTYLPMWQYLL